jgi:hypothetical protein
MHTHILQNSTGQRWRRRQRAAQRGARARRDAQRPKRRGPTRLRHRGQRRGAFCQREGGCGGTAHPRSGGGHGGVPCGLGAKPGCVPRRPRQPPGRHRPHPRKDPRNRWRLRRRGNPFHLLLILLYLCPPPPPSRTPIFSSLAVASSGGGGFLEPFCVSCLAPSRFSQTDCAPLHEAAFHGHLEVLKVLLVAGANAHALEKVSKRRKKDTGTPPSINAHRHPLF